METPLSPAKQKVQLWQWLCFPICGFLVMFAVPSMSFGLYKKSFQIVLGLQPAEVQDIVSIQLVGGMVLCCIPGLVYDKYGYTVTLVSGGIMASSGAFLSYWLLSDGGAPGSPTWYGLGLSLMLMSYGARTQFVASICAILGVFPSHLGSSVSAGMAVWQSVGDVMLPHAFSLFSRGSETTDSGDLKDLKPVSSVFLFLSVTYACIAVVGLTIVRFVKPMQAGPDGSVGSGFAQKLRTLRDPDAMTLFLNHVLHLGFCYLFMTSGVAEAAAHANAASERAGVIALMGVWGLGGRLVHGLCSDALLAYTRAGEAGEPLMFVSAISCNLVGFCLMMADIASWKIAAYVIAFGFGGLTALFPGAVRKTFPNSEVGFWLGSLYTLLGLLNFVYGRVGAALHWSSTFYACGSIGSLLAIILWLKAAYMKWGPQQPLKVSAEDGMSGASIQIVSRASVISLIGSNSP